MYSTNCRFVLSLAAWLLVAHSGCEHAATTDVNPPVRLAPPLSASGERASPPVVSSPKPDDIQSHPAVLPGDPVARIKAPKQQLPPGSPGAEPIGPRNGKITTAAERLIEVGSTPDLINVASIQDLNKAIGSSAKSPSETTQPALVEMKFVGRIPHKPPIRSLLFDVTLRNPSAGVCCFLLPTYLSEPPTIAQADDLTLEVCSYQEKMLLGNFFGDTRFLAVCVPPNGELVLRRLAIKTAEEPVKQPASIQVVIARELSINDQPAEAWYGTKQELAKEIEITAKDGTRLGSGTTTDHHTVIVKVGEAHRLKLQVELAADSLTPQPDRESPSGKE